ncbi:MAG: site-2 protease family protein [Bdellovibrionaceae bacterium]|nr:site-2 protease family protein [Pseudobdellovibrionaceae bacterium]
MDKFIEIGHKLALFYVPFLFALCFHEFAHGWIAKLRGDNTAEMMGRLTLNPMAHADWIGTFALPIMAIVFSVPIFFGWAKPVPVNIRNLKNPRVDMFWIALAGPASNILLAVLGALVLGITARTVGATDMIKALVQMLSMFITINLFLAIFNFLPLHPLDGGKVLARFLPASINYKLEQNEHITSLVLLVLVMSGSLRFLVIPVEYLHNLFITLALGMA